MHIKGNTIIEGDVYSWANHLMFFCMKMIFLSHLKQYIEC